MMGRMVAAIPMPPVIKRRSGELAGLGLAIAATALTIALATYYPGDPSLNRVGDAPAQNALGLFGATMADLSKQTLGWTSALLVACLFGWSWRLLLKDETMRWAWRVVALLTALVTGSTILALLAAATEAAFLQPASGAIGIVVGVKLIPVLGNWGLAAVTALLFLLSLPVALGLRIHEYLAISLVVRQTSAAVVGGVASFVALLRRPGQYEEETAEENEEETDELEEEDRKSVV